MVLFTRRCCDGPLRECSGQGASVGADKIGGGRPLREVVCAVRTNEIVKTLRDLKEKTKRKYKAEIEESKPFVLQDLVVL